MSIENVTDLVSVSYQELSYDAGMATPKSKPSRRRLFLAEHREAAELSADDVAEALGIDRVSVYRWERQQHRLNPDKQTAYAHAVGVEPEDLWRRPGRPSVDGMLAKVPDDQVQGVAEMVAIWLKTGAGK